MANYDGLTPGQVLADASVAEFIKELGLGIAEAQAALDRNSIEQIAILSQTVPSFSGKSLIELGLTPPFYHYQYADLEVSMSLSLKVQKDFGVNLGFNIGSSESEEESASSGSTGQVGIEVRFGGGEPAKGVIRLNSATPGTVVAGNTTTSLVSSAPSGATDVAIVPNSIRGTAYALADRLRDEVVPEIDRVTVGIVSGTPVTPTTNLTSVFACTANQIVVNGTQGSPAWALLALTSHTITSVTVNNVPIGSFAETTLVDATTTVAEEIDDHAGFTARVLVNAGRVQVTPMFDLDGDQLDPGVLDDLRAVARMLKANPAWKLRIDGHTDLSGASAYNLDLSQRRANRVNSFLLAQGVQGSQLTTQALGETQPINPDPDPEAANRRAELHLTTGPAHLIEIIDATGTPGAWNPMSVTPTTSGSFVTVQNAANAVSANTSWVQLYNSPNERRLYLGSGASAPNHYDYTPASTSEADVATALAQAITDHVVDVEAWAVGNVVHILPSGSYAELTLYTTERSNAGNLLPLTTTGSISRTAAFSGGLDPAEPTDGDTVSIGSTQLKVRASGANFVNREFNKGIDAAATATNLATAISSISGFSAAAAGAVVTITGTSGTTIATSNANAFLLSAPKIPGLAQFESQERSRAMAWGGSLGVRYSRQFGVEMTGNSSIRARLVAIPAPAELLDEIRDYLTSVE